MMIELSSAIIFHTREKVGIVATIHDTVVQKDKWQELMKNFEELEKLVVSIDLFVILIPSLSFLGSSCPSCVIYSGLIAKRQRHHYDGCVCNRRRDFNHVVSVTITIETSTNDATTLSRMNFSGYVGHATIFG